MLLATSVFLAIRAAIQAADPEADLSQLGPPLTSRKVAEYCQKAALDAILK